jgi:hypothetical protein
MRRANNNNNQRQKGRKRRRTAVNTLAAQNGAGVSGRDMVRSVRKFMVFSTIPIENSNSEYAFGLKNFNVSGAGTPLASLLDDYAKVYEQYRVRRCIVRCNPGKGFTNDLRLKSFVSARVDVDQQPLTTTVSSLKSLINSENSVTKTLIAKGNQLMCDYRPQCRVNTTASLPLLPNALQFFPLNDYSTHIWKGATLACFIPEPSISTGVSLTISCEVDVEFRGRVTSPTLFSLTTTHINQEAPPVTPDITGTLVELKNSFLTGGYFPLEVYPFSFGNIPDSVTADMILEKTFRVQATMVKYRISAYNVAANSYEAMELVE